jgi:hypothetical protein
MNTLNTSIGLFLLQAAGPGAAIQTALESVAPELRTIGIALMTIGFLVWGLAKLAAPLAPEMAAQTQGYISKAFMGMLVIGLASTLAGWIGGLIPT